METWLPFLAVLFLVSIPATQLSYTLGKRAGYKAGFLNGYQDGLEDEEARTPGLEIIDTHLSGKVEWRYGTGRTELTGLCHKSVYPASALDTVAAHHALKNEQRHLDAADDLVDDFFSTHGPFAEGPFRNLDNGL